MTDQTKNIRINFSPTAGFVKVGEFFVCNCGLRIAKKTREGYQFAKNQRGQSIKIRMEFDHTGKIKCEKCDRGFNCIKLG